MTITTQQMWAEFSLPLRQFIARRIPNEADVEDILQEVFYKIHRNSHTLKDEAKLQVWIYQIVRNAITDYYRRQKITVELPETLANTVEEQDRSDISACLRPMIDTLPEKYRQALLLTEFEGLTQKAVAEKLGLSFSGAKSRVQRARQHVKEKLLQCCQFEFDRWGTVLDCQPTTSEQISGNMSNLC